MQRLAVAFASWLLLAGGAYPQALKTSSLIVAAADGGWYAATEREALYPNPKSTLRKFLADFRTVVWERELTGDYPRELCATPDGGVAFLGVSFERGTVRAFDGEGNTRFTLALDLPSMSPPSLPQAHLVAEADGSLLLASGFARYEREPLSFSNAYRVSSGSLDIYRISVEGKQTLHAKLPIPASGLGGMALDGRGSLFVAGSTESDDLPLSATALQTQRQAGTCSRGISMPSRVPCTSGWVAKLDAASLALQASTYLGGAVENRLTALAIDQQGFPVVSGATSDRLLEVENPYPRTPGTVPPAAASVVQGVATLSRLSPHLDALVDSTWIEGAARTGAFALAIDAQNRILLGGYTATQPGLPNRAEWASACGPRPGQTSWGFVMRLSSRIETMERVLQFESPPSGRLALDPDGQPVFEAGVLPLESGVACVVNGASFAFAGTTAPGLLMSVYGGPFADDTPVTLGGVTAPVLARTSSAIHFVAPRELHAGTSADLRLGDQFVRHLEIFRAQPAWKAAVSPEGKLIEAGSYLIEARRSDDEWNSRESPLRPDEEVRAYATGLDLTKPLHLYIDYPKLSELKFEAGYVPGTAEGVVEIRFMNPYPKLALGGLMSLRLVNDGVETPVNPGFLLNPFH